VFFQIHDGCEVIVCKGAEGSNFLFFDPDENRFIADINTGAVGVILDKEDISLLLKK
jgi:hypothetical protein